MADLTTLLSKFLTNLWAGNITSPVTSTAIRTSTTAADTLKIQAYDTDGAAYADLLTATAGTTPTLAAPTTLYFGGVAVGNAKMVTSGSSVTFLTGTSSAYLNLLGNVLNPTAAQITAGSGTGITLNQAGAVQGGILYKIVIDRTAFVAAATTGDVTIGTLPAKTFLTHAIADVTQTFALAASTLGMTLGSSAGGNQYLLSFNAGAAAQYGDAAAELGASLAPATAPTLIGALGSWTATTPISLRLTSSSANLGDGATTALTQGSVTFYITTTRML